MFDINFHSSMIFDALFGKDTSDQDLQHYFHKKCEFFLDKKQSFSPQSQPTLELVNRPSESSE